MQGHTVHRRFATGDGRGVPLCDLGGAEGGRGAKERGQGPAEPFGRPLREGVEPAALGRREPMRPGPVVLDGVGRRRGSGRAAVGRLPQLLKNDQVVGAPTVGHDMVNSLNRTSWILGF